MRDKVYLAIDLGAESGRVMAGIWNGRKIGLEEIHRFSNGPVAIGTTLRWDVLRLWEEIQVGLTLAGKQFGNRIISVGADTWGVDFVLLTSNDEIIGMPYHYRDTRTNGMLENAFRIVPQQDIFRQTGIQFMQFNTLYQLLAMQAKSPALLAQAECLLLMPDFLHWCLCGAKFVEFTNGSTTQCLHPIRRDWARGLLRKLGLPTRIFPEIIQPGTDLGNLLPSVAKRTGLTGVRVVAPPTHDTASAIVGIPTANTDSTSWAYISSGTWSLMGVEAPQAVLTPRARELGLTNEGGVDGTYRLLKNIMGLWLAQQCKRAVEATGRTYDYDQIVALATRAKPFRSLINPNDPRFLNPPDMPAAIRAFCRETRQPDPTTDGELFRCAYESLALAYRATLAELEELTGGRIHVIHIVGGGSQNKLLNQFAADACQRPVLAGPVEATALGNLLVQIRADGELKSLNEMRAALRCSTNTTRFDPQPKDAWNEAVARFTALVTPTPTCA